MGKGLVSGHIFGVMEYWSDNLMIKETNEIYGV